MATTVSFKLYDSVCTIQLTEFINQPSLFILRSKSVVSKRKEVVGSFREVIGNVSQRSDFSDGGSYVRGVIVRGINVRRLDRLCYLICRAMKTSLVGRSR